MSIFNSDELSPSPERFSQQLSEWQQQVVLNNSLAALSQGNMDDADVISVYSCTEDNSDLLNKLHRLGAGRKKLIQVDVKQVFIEETDSVV
jgi:hypothetical protein